MSKKEAQKKVKRMSGEGSIRQRPNGLWELTIMDGYQDDGRRRYKSFYGKTQREVKDKWLAYQSAKKEGLVETDYTFDEWADLWFESHKDNIMPTTQENYQYTLRHLKTAFAGRALRDIKVMDVERFLKQMQSEGKSASSLSQYRGTLFQILNKAEANMLISKNPVRFAEKMRHKGLKKEKDAFTAEEVTCLMQELSHDKIGLSIRLMLGTGMRTQELLALEPGHIEQDGSWIRIRQAINMVKGTAMVGTPKSKDSYRDVPVPENLRWCAVQLRESSGQLIWESPKKRGEPVNPSYFRDLFQRALEAIPEVRKLTPHSCRHTYVSQMQALGVDLATIQSIVGHADIDMTQHYLHVQQEVKFRATKLFSDTFLVPQNNLDDSSTTK